MTELERIGGLLQLLNTIARHPSANIAPIVNEVATALGVSTPVLPLSTPNIKSEDSCAD